MAETPVTTTLLERMKSIKNFPSLPTVALEILAISRKKDVSIAEMVAVIEKDPALTGKILRVVNSPLFGMPRQISDLGRATVALGMRSVKTTALGFGSVTSVNSTTHYWSR